MRNKMSADELKVFLFLLRLFTNKIFLANQKAKDREREMLVRAEGTFSNIISLNLIANAMLAQQNTALFDAEQRKKTAEAALKQLQSKQEQIVHFLTPLP